MVSVRRGVLCLLWLVIGMVAGLVTAQHVHAQGGEPPLATRSGNWVNVTVNITDSAAVSATPEIIIADGQVKPAVWLSRTQEPLTVTVLVESVAGGGLIDTVRAATAIAQLLPSLRATDFMTVAITDKVNKQMPAAFNWVPISQATNQFAGLQGKFRFEALDNSQSGVSDDNFLSLLDLAESLRGQGHLVLIMTNGVGVKSRSLDVAAMLVQLMTIEDKYLDPGISGLLGQFDVTHLARIDDPALADKLIQNAAAVRRVTGVLSFTATSSQAYTATLHIGDMRLALSVPAAPQLPTPTAAPATPAPGQNAAAAKATPANVEPTSVAPTTHAQVTPLPVLAGVALVVVVVVLAVLAFLVLRRRRYHPYLLVGERKIYLKQPLAVDPAWWPGAGNGGASYAQIARYEKGTWVITVEPGAYMAVNGLRSRRNRLQPDARIAFDPEGQVVMTYIEVDRPANGKKDARVDQSNSV